MKKITVFILIILFVIACGTQKGKIPEGFTFLSNDDQQVIVDQSGSEFVWIPVSRLQRYDFNQGKYVENGKPIERIYYGEERTQSVIYDTEQNIDTFKKSVQKYGGFYISKYFVRADKKANHEGEPLTLVTRGEALGIAQGFLSEGELYSTLPSSYAYDALFLYAREQEQFPLEEQGNLLGWSTEYSSNGYYDDVADCVARSSAQDTFAKREYNGDVANSLTGFRIVLYYK